MAKFRQIHVNYWQDGFILNLPSEEKYFYIYLMTNSKTTQCGIYEIPLKVMEIETGLSSERIFELLHKFVSYKRIKFNDETREVMLLNWVKHNPPKSPKIKACVVKELKEIKFIPYATEFSNLCIQYGYPIDTLSIPYVRVEKPGQHPYGEEEEQEREKEREKEKEMVSDSILKIINKYKLQIKGTYQLEEISSYVGIVDIEVIEHCIKQSEGKSVAYAVTIIERCKSEGKTTKESIRHLQPVPDKANQSKEPFREKEVEVYVRPVS